MESSVVAIVGSANMDLTFSTGRMPTPGETLLGGRFDTHPGGKGANAAVAVGRLGGAGAFVGCVGEDAFGAVLRESLASASVDLRWLSASREPTGVAGIFVDDDGRNMIVVAPGANTTLGSPQVREALDALRPSVVLAGLEIPLAAVEAAAATERFVLNPAPARSLPDALLATCFVLTPNETELHALTGIDPVDDAACARAASSLLDRGVQNVVVTLGARGSYWACASGGRHFAPLTVVAVDTTAAGDAFNGALALFLAEGRDLANAIPLANGAGALATTKAGAQDAMPNRDDLRTLMGALL